MKLIYFAILAVLHGVLAMRRRPKVFSSMISSVFRRRRRKSVDINISPASALNPTGIVAIEPSEPEALQWTIRSTTCFPYIPQNVAYEKFDLLEPTILTVKGPLLLHHTLETDKNVHVDLVNKDINKAFGEQNKWKKPIVNFYLQLAPVSDKHCQNSKVKLLRRCFTVLDQLIGKPYALATMSNDGKLEAVDKFQNMDTVQYCTYKVEIEGGSKKCEFMIESGHMTYRSTSPLSLSVKRPIIPVVKRKPWRNPNSIFQWTTRRPSSFPFVDIEAQFEVFQMKKKKITMQRNSAPLRLHEYGNVELDIEVLEKVDESSDQIRWTNPLNFMLKLVLEVREGTDCSDARVELIGKSVKGRRTEILSAITGESTGITFELNYSESRDQFESDYVYDLTFSQPPEPRVVKEFPDDSSYESPDQLKPCRFDILSATKSYY